MSDNDVDKDVFRSRDGQRHCVTSLLQVCVCALSSESGELCLQCGCHGEWFSDHNLVCEKDDCGMDAELHLCAACNIAFHAECMDNLHWGLSYTLSRTAMSTIVMATITRAMATVSS